MKENISMIGGDLRILNLAKLLKEEKCVYTYGLENAEDFNNSRIIKCESLKKCIDASSTIISGVPFSMDDIFVNGTFCKNKIEINQVASLLENKTFIAGKIPENFYEMTKNKNVKIIDILQNEEFTILNCISTAEGAIKIAIEETKFTLNGSNILILGFGRIGKILAKMLEGFGVNLYCEARKKEDLAWIEAFGYKKVPLQNLSQNLGKFDIIFNTIPSIILDEEKLKLLKKDLLIIDLASSPGGVDRDISKKMGIKNIFATGLPRKNCT